MNISFRPLAPSDLDNLVRWAQEEEVAYWWHEAGSSEDLVRAKWEARTRGADEKTRIFIINVDSTDIGLIQTYRLADYPDHAAEVQLPDSSGIDVFIGIPGWRNRGVGTALVRQFVDEVVFAEPSIERCAIDPEPENRRAIRAYEKAGFQHVRSYRSQLNDVDVYLMAMERTS